MHLFKETHLLETERTFTYTVLVTTIEHNHRAPSFDLSTLAKHHAYRYASLGVDRTSVGGKDSRFIVLLDPRRSVSREMARRQYRSTSPWRGNRSGENTRARAGGNGSGPVTPGRISLI